MIEITWTCGSIDEARKVGRYLVQEKFVACAQITPWIESIYLWDNKVETAQETKVTLKTTEERFNEIKQIILENCSYELPEIIYKPITGGSQEFLDWVAEGVKA